MKNNNLLSRLHIRIEKSTLMFCMIMLGMSVQLIAQPRATTFQPGGCGKDALIASCIQCGYSTNNYGNAAEFNSMGWTNSGYDSDQRSLIQFDLLSIPPGSVVQSAILSLYFDPFSSNGQHAALTGSNEAELVKLTSSWTENSVTWVNQPGYTLVNKATLPASTSATQNYNIDVTVMIQDFVNTPSLNYGMMLKQISESPYVKLIFASSDHPDASLHPRLEVSYFPSSAPLAAITVSGPATIICGSTVSLNANVNTDVSYQWNRNGTPVAGAVTSSYSATQAGSYTVTLTNSCLLSATSAPFNVTSSNYNCAVPQNVTISNVTTTTATINWTNSSAPQYQVRYRKVGTNAYTNKTLNSAPCNTSLLITGLKKNTSYYMSIRALCSSGNSAFSPEVLFTTLATNNRYALQETSDDESVAVFPSPVLNDLNIQIQSTSLKKVTVSLFDLTGRLIIQNQIVLQVGINESRLETIALPAGQYLLTVVGLETNFRQRIIKQ